MRQTSLVLNDEGKIGVIDSINDSYFHVMYYDGQEDLCPIRAFQYFYKALGNTEDLKGEENET